MFIPSHSTKPFLCLWLNDLTQDRNTTTGCWSVLTCLPVNYSDRPRSFDSTADGVAVEHDEMFKENILYLLFRPTNSQYVNSNVYFVEYSDIFWCTLMYVPCNFYSFLSRPTNHNIYKYIYIYIYINNVLHIVNIPTCFDTSATTSDTLFLLLY